MRISDIPFGTTDWSQIQRTEHKGETGLAYWRTQHFGNIRVRMVGMPNPTKMTGKSD
jgi:hypothetical protein